MNDLENADLGFMTSWSSKSKVKADLKSQHVGYYMWWVETMALPITVWSQRTSSTPERSLKASNKLA